MQVKPTGKENVHVVPVNATQIVEPIVTQPQLANEIVKTSEAPEKQMVEGATNPENFQEKLNLEADEYDSNDHSGSTDPDALISSGHAERQLLAPEMPTEYNRNATAIFKHKAPISIARFNEEGK